MKKEYEKPCLNMVEIKGKENIAETAGSLSAASVQDGKTNAYGIISYNALKY